MTAQVDQRTPPRGEPHGPLCAPKQEVLVVFTFEFFRIRPSDSAHAMLDRISQIAPDIEAAKMKARSLFETWDLPQKPDGVRILDEAGAEIFTWKKGDV